MALATERLVRTSPGTTGCMDPLAFVGIFLSCNAAGILSPLIRKPTCAFVHRKIPRIRRSEDIGFARVWTTTVSASIAILEA